MQPNPWVEWICHTNFSFLVGASHPKELVATAVQHGYQGLGITDYDGVYGIARAYRDLKKIQLSDPLATVSGNESKPPLRLFYGAEIHLAQDHLLPISIQDTLVLLATTHRGYFQLCELLTCSHAQFGKSHAAIPMDVLMGFKRTRQ